MSSLLRNITFRIAIDQLVTNCLQNQGLIYRLALALALALGLALSLVLATLSTHL